MSRRYQKPDEPESVDERVAACDVGREMKRSVLRRTTLFMTAPLALVACDMATTSRPSPGAPVAAEDAPAIVKGCLERRFPDVLAAQQGKLLESSCESNDKSAEQRIAEGAFKIGASSAGADGIFTSSGLVDGSSGWPKADQDQLAEKHRKYVEDALAAAETTRGKLAKAGGECVVVATELQYFDAGMRCALTNEREGLKPYLAGFVSACTDAAGGGKETREQCEAAGKAAFVERIAALQKKPPR
jgi:hypothetical protein